MNSVGCLIAPLHGPIIYFIFSKDVLYIGETQKYPAIRIASHLNNNGSFWKALFTHGDPDVKYTDCIEFYAVECTKSLSYFPTAQHRIVTQAIEHKLHCLLHARPSRLGLHFQIISDTNHTAPTRFRYWQFAEEEANRVIDIICKERGNHDFATQ